MSFSHPTLHGSPPVRAPNMVNGMRLRGVQVDRSPLYPSADSRFAVPAGTFPQQAPPLSHRPTGATRTVQLSNEYNGYEPGPSVNEATSYLSVPTDTSRFYPNSLDGQSWTMGQPSQSTTPLSHATQQTQTVPPRTVSMDTPLTNPRELHAADALIRIAMHPMLPFCPWASLIFLNLPVGGNFNLQGMPLNGLGMFMMLNHTFSEPPPEDSNRGLPPTETSSTSPMNLDPGPSNSLDLQGVEVEAREPTPRRSKPSTHRKPSSKRVPPPVKGDAVKTLSPEEHAELLRTAFTNASPSPNLALRTLLDDVLASNFLKRQLLEPTLTQNAGRLMVQKLSSIAGYPQICIRRGDQSIYTLFLEKGSNRCLLCGEYRGGPARGVGCVRRHLEHRPFVCDGLSCEICDERGVGPAKFYQASHLADHIKSRTQKIVCVHDDCDSTLRRGNVQRHWEAQHAETPFPYDVYKRYARTETTMSPISMISDLSFSPYSASLDVASNPTPSIYDILGDGML